MKFTPKLKLLIADSWFNTKKNIKIGKEFNFKGIFRAKRGKLIQYEWQKSLS